jgi:hypothetical protein
MYTCVVAKFVSSLAWHEMRLFAAKVIWHFDVEVLSTSEHWLDQRVYLIWEKKPLKVTLTPVQ